MMVCITANWNHSSDLLIVDTGAMVAALLWRLPHSTPVNWTKRNSCKYGVNREQLFRGGEILPSDTMNLSSVLLSQGKIDHRSLIRRDSINGKKQS